MSLFVLIKKKKRGSSFESKHREELWRKLHAIVQLNTFGKREVD